MIVYANTRILENIKNRIIRHKVRDESQFRVHFYIRHVYYDHQLQPEQFIENVALRLSKIASLSTLQIVPPLKRFVDLSVGFVTDQSAIVFFESGRRVFLPGEHGAISQHELILSQSFCAYYRTLKDSKKSTHERQESIDNQSSNSSSSSYKLSRRRSREIVWKKKQQYKRREEDQFRINHIWVFCIPLEYKEREVFILLAQKGLKPKSYEWRSKQDMQYLQVELGEGISQRQLQFIDIRIDKCPLLILPRLQDPNNVYQHILKHQVEINFQKDIDQSEFIKVLQQVGGVILLIKDEYYGPRKYVSALNSSTKVQILRQELLKRYKNIHIDRPKYPVRLCRLEKNFTFLFLCENLKAFQQQM